MRITCRRSTIKSGFINIIVFIIIILIYIITFNRWFHLKRVFYYNRPFNYDYIPLGYRRHRIAV